MHDTVRLWTALETGDWPTVALASRSAWSGILPLPSWPMMGTGLPLVVAQRLLQGSTDKVHRAMLRWSVRHQEKEALHALLHDESSLVSCGKKLQKKWFSARLKGWTEGADMLRDAIVQRGETPLWDALKINSIMVKHAHGKTLNPSVLANICLLLNDFPEQKSQVFHQSIQYRIAPLQELLLPDVNPHDVDDEGNTALMLALKTGQGQLARRLLDNDDSPEHRLIVNRAGHHALIVALLSDHPWLAHMLVHPDAINVPTIKDKINDGDFSRGSTPFMIAVHRDLLDLIETMLPFALVQKKSSIGVNALMLAAYRGNLKLIASLIPLCDPLLPAQDGDTVLMYAAMNGQVEAVKTLIPVSDPFAFNKTGWTALMLAAVDVHVETVNALIPVSDCRAMQKDGLTALMLAAQEGHVETVNALIPVSDCMAMEKDGWTALMLAAQEGHVDSVNALIPVSDCMAMEKDGWTALMLAAAHGHVDSVNALIPVSAPLAVNQEGKDALMVAIHKRKKEVLERLLPISDLKQVTAKGINALMMLAERIMLEQSDCYERCMVQAMPGSDLGLHFAEGDNLLERMVENVSTATFEHLAQQPHLPDAVRLRFYENCADLEWLDPVLAYDPKDRYIEYLDKHGPSNLPLCAERLRCTLKASIEEPPKGAERKRL